MWLSVRGETLSRSVETSLPQIRFREQGDLGDCRAYNCPRDAQSNLISGQPLGTDETLSANACARRELLPAIIFPAVQRERVNSLAKRNELAQSYNIK